MCEPRRQAADAIASGPMAVTSLGSNKRNVVLELMRGLHVGVVVPLLRDPDRGRTSSPLLLWRLRSGLLRLRRDGQWTREQRKYLVCALEATSQPLDRSTLLELCAWLEDRIRQDGDDP